MNDRESGDAAPEFLTVEHVLALHQRQLQRFGGGDGIRELGLLESAVAQPCASVAGAFLHTNLFEMAAAYLFHICSNHPFVDGNKRVGLLAALTFLHLNGIRLLEESEALHALTMGVAEGRFDKTAIAAELERLARSKR